MAFVRGLVSKKKIRYQKDGFDLDLTYITPRIIAMGFPSEGSEASYRNPMEEVQKFFNQYHNGDKMRIVNLCSERAYKPEKFGGDKHVVRYPFDDHNPAPLATICAACDDMAAFLEEDEDHVVAIHCKAGKGRTGMMIACLLRRLDTCKSAMEALKYFADKRTSNSKGVTIPSQMRYVHYYEQTLKLGEVPAPKTYRVTHIRLITIPNLDVMGGCDPYFDVRACVLSDPSDPSKGVDMLKYYNYFDEMGKKVKNYMPKHKYADLDLTKLSKPLYVRGDCKFVFYDYDRFSADDKAMHFWFNTGFISNNYLLFHKEVVDRACKDKECAEFDPDFKVEVFFEPADGVDFDPRKVGKSVEDDKEDPSGDDDEEAPAGAGAAAGGGGE